jgi:ribonucleoside-diphosphate reductase alpha chain
MTQRHRLPNRRESTTFDLASQGLRFSCTVSCFADGSLAEIFLQNHKAGSQAGINAQDSAVVCSIALQYGVPFEVIRRALMRDARGNASGPLGTALDLVARDNR